MGGIGKTAPTVTAITDGAHRGAEMHEHPAFGMVDVVRWTRGGGGERMFGSDLKHNSGLTITVRQATMIRDLHQDRTGQGTTIVSFSMSESQWARFVAGVGNGSGTPITLNGYMTGGFVEAPEIASAKASKKEVHSAEVRAGVERALADAMEAVDELGAMIEQGRLSKKELKELQHRIKTRLKNAPSNAEFAFKQFDTAVEDTVNQAMTQFDSYVNATAVRLGMEQLRGMAAAAGLQLTHDTEGA